MIICDGCPCFNILVPKCQISGGIPFAKFVGDSWVVNYFHPNENIGCPLKRIELRDGTVFVPEAK